MNKPQDLPTLPAFADYLLDEPDQGLFSVRRDAFTNPELFELEMRYIWEGNWVYLAHESQLPNRHDYFTTHIGRQPVVLIRGQDDVIRCFINACPHRGATLCRTQRGNRKFIACSYHGWTFDTAGRNVDIKDAESGGYPESFAAQNHDLTEIARFESYKGFLFGSLNADVASLSEHLAGAAGAIDILVDEAPEGLEVIPGVAKYTFNGNWKIHAENGVDGYHATTVHANYFRVVTERAKQEANKAREDKVKALDATKLAVLPGGTYQLGHGHSLMWAEMPNPEVRPLNERREQLIALYGEDRVKCMINRMRNLLLYPNVYLMDQTSSQIRVFRPLAVDRTEVTIFCIAPKGESAAARERRIRQYEDFFNASGMATPDDLEEFERTQEGLSTASVVPWQQGYDRGWTRIVSGGDQYAAQFGLSPEASSPDAQDETALYQGQYREWLRLLTKGLANQQ